MVRTNPATEFESNPILIDQIRIESTAGSNAILIVKICAALDQTVYSNERIYNRTDRKEIRKIRYVTTCTTITMFVMLSVAVSKMEVILHQTWSEN